MNIIKKNRLSNLRVFAPLREKIRYPIYNSCQFVKFVDCICGIVLILLLTVLVSCVEEGEENVLAKIGDVEITVEEFLNRSELTPRPHYCRSGSEDDKIIILNTLVLEKLFAIEGRDKSELLEKKMFNAYIRGRKEQYMREELFGSMSVNENELDSADIARAYKLAGNVYDVEFYTLNTKTAMELYNKMKSNPEQKNMLFDSLDQLEKVPRHQVDFYDPEYPSLHDALYSTQWNKGDIVGPIRLRETKYMVLKIDNVLYDLAMSQTQVTERRIRVKEKLVKKQTNLQWNQFTSELMSGKHIQFVPEITRKVAELWSKKFVDNEEITQLEGGSDQRYGKFVEEIELLANETMFKVNDKKWTVNDFKNELSSHPLVFRKVDLSPGEFIQQFRLAVVDLIQDHFVTREAYTRGLDEDKQIQRNTAMWEDAFLALEQRKKVFTQINATNADSTKKQDFHALIDPYLDKLAQKYKEQIEVNVDLLRSVKLTHTDYVTVQQFVPYNKLVPMFPVLTRIDDLKFGSLLN